MPRLLKVVGQDPSLRNWGLAFGTYDLDTKKLFDVTVDVIQPVIPTGKAVRQNSTDIEASVQLTVGAVNAIRGAHATFVEVPVGSQSARAMCGYGVCVGVLGAMRGGGLTFYELTPTEVKMAGFGKSTATKKEMIGWAMSKHPEANWPMYKRDGKLLVSEANAEHMADALAAIYAGLRSNQFQQSLSILATQQ